MNANRVSGPTPSEPNKGHTTDPKTLGQGKKVVEKVEKVEEVDEDGSRARNRFQRALDDAEIKFSDAMNMSRTPSPFETSFHVGDASKGAATSVGKGAPLPSNPSLGSSAPDPIPSPGYSPPPNVQIPSPNPAGEDDLPPLPRSNNFWANSNEPPDQPLPPQNFQENYNSSNQGFSQNNQGNSQGDDKTHDKKGDKSKKGEQITGAPVHKEHGIEGVKGFKGKEKAPVKGEKANLFSEEEAVPTKPEKKGAPPPFPFKGKAEDEELPSAKKGAKKVQPGPASRYLNEKEEGRRSFPPAPGVPGAPVIPKGKEEDLQREALPRMEEEKSRSEKKGVPTSAIPQARREKEAEVRASKDREKRDGEKERDKRPIEIQGPSIPPLPPEVVPLAQAAAVQATPYVTSPEAMQLFYHMVGTIHIMTAPPGISRTEFVLNHPSLQNSRFFGAKILIEKYATAPDSLNIRLSGSNEAVTAFNKNIPSLMAAFQNGNFPFRVNRIDTAFSTERPIFRRKEPGQDKGSSGDGGGFDQNKR